MSRCGRVVHLPRAAAGRCCRHRTADPERRHVGDVRRCHLHNLGPGPAGDGELDDLGGQRLHVGGGCHDRQGAVNFEPELRHRPRRVMPGLPRLRSLLRGLSRSRPARRCTPAGELLGLLMHRGKCLHFSRTVCAPTRPAAARAGLCRPGLPGDGAPSLGFRPPGVLRCLLAEQPDGPLARRLPVLFRVAGSLP